MAPMTMAAVSHCQFICIFPNVPRVVRLPVLVQLSLPFN